MLANFDRIARVLGYLNSKLSPRLLWRLDAYLMRNRPLVWRTHVHWLAWWCLLATVAVVGFACATAGSPDDTWADEGATQFAIFLRWIAVSAGVFWAVQQLRLPVGELGVRGHVKLAVVNLLALQLLWLPAEAFALVENYLSAHAMSREELKQAQHFFERNQYWVCPLPDEAPPNPPANDAKLIDAALARFGFARGPGQLCDQPGGFVMVRRGRNYGEGGLLDLQAQLKHLDVAQLRAWTEVASFWRGWQLLVAASVVSLLTLVSHPSYAWRRLFRIRPSRRSGVVVARVRVPTWMMRIETWLLVNRPIWWAARLHSPTFLLLWLLGLAFTLGSPPFSDGGWILGLFSALVPYLWLLLRRHDLMAVLPRDWPSLLQSFLAATCSLPLVTIMVGCATGRKELTVLAVAEAQIALFAIGMAIVRLRRGRLATYGVSQLGSLVLLLVWGVGAMLLKNWVLIVLLLVVPSAALMVLMSRHKPDKANKSLQALCAEMLVFATPALLGLLCVATVAPLLKAVEWTSLQESIATAVLAMLYTTMVCLTFCFGLRPLANVLARTESEPR